MRNKELRPDLNLWAINLKFLLDCRQLCYLHSENFRLIAIKLSLGDPWCRKLFRGIRKFVWNFFRFYTTMLPKICENFRLIAIKLRPGESMKRKTVLWNKEIHADLNLWAINLKFLLDCRQLCHLQSVQISDWKH